MKYLICLLTLLLLALPFNACKEIVAQGMSKGITFTAPDEDGGGFNPDPQGRPCTSYDVRFAEDSLDLVNDWNNCDGGVQSYTPSLPGVTENLTITGFSSNKTYYLAIKGIDEAYNIAEKSVNIELTTPDADPPGTITDLQEWVE